MLPTEFFLLNATTLLLWLFQYCSHDVLLLFILLGAFIFLFILSNTIYKIVRIGTRFLCIILNYTLRKYLSSYFCNLQRIPLARHLPAFASTVISRIISDSSSDSSYTPHLDRRLTLPQILALNPVQWAALEAVNNPTVSEPDNIDNSENIIRQHQLANTASSHPTTPIASLRRSRRARRTRNIYSS